MKYLKITNKGLLDENIIFLMGATTKTNDVSKIGQFGTGLKYSLAWLLRNNVDFKLFLGTRQIAITIKTIKVRDTDFDLIMVDGRETSITTNMGKDWKAWMILRELWCNAIDEDKNAKKEVTDRIENESDTTAFFIQLTGDILEAYNNWNKYFNNRNPICSDGFYGSVYQSTGKTMKIYRKGILVKEYADTESVFDYDFPNGNINELREYIGYIDFDVAETLAHLSKEGVHYFIDNISDSKKEAKIDISYSDFKSWKQAIGNAKVISYESYRTLSDIKPETTKENNFVQIPSNFYKRLTKDIKGISALMVSDDANTFFEVIDQRLNQNIKEAMTILEACDYFVDAELTFITGIFNDKNILGRINLKERVVMLSTTLRDMGLKELIYTIVEETEHFRTSFSDNTREFQYHFIKLYVNTLLQSNEIKL